MAKTLKEIRRSRKSPRRWLWDGMIKEKTVNILIGQQSRGKSMLATGLIKEMLKTQRGQSYLGRGVRAGKILYISTEMPEDSIEERLRALGVDGRMRSVNKRFFVHHEPTPTLDKIKQEIDAHDPDLVVIDILGGLMLGEGYEINSYDDFNTIVARLKLLGPAILLIHHMNKQNKAMGSIGALSAMDTRMEMLETDRESDENYDITIFQRMHVYGKDVRDQYIDVSFKYPVFELAQTEEVQELDKPLSKLMEAVILAAIRQQKDDDNSGNLPGYEGTFQEVAAQCHLLDKYQFNPKRLGALLRDNEETLRNNNIYYESKRTKHGFHLKIWYDADAEHIDDLGGDDDGQECADPS